MTARALGTLYAAGWRPDSRVVETVAKILADVRSRGDDAVVEYTRRFDDPDFSAERLRIALPPLAQARTLVPADIAAGLELARERVAQFHARQRMPDFEYDEIDGTRYAMLVRPLANVGAYVPGGSASLPSSAIMTVVPAKLAGVERIVVATPPARDPCGVNPAVLFACVLCGVDELYAVGGAQAIAALAFGTRTIALVDKIVGPGNVWVTEAKRQVFGTVGIDALAGPSEILVAADDTARADYVAGEILAQAEHDPQSRVAVVANDRSLLERVAQLLEERESSDRNADRRACAAAWDVADTRQRPRRDGRRHRSIRARASLDSNASTDGARLARASTPAQSSSGLRRPLRPAITSLEPITFCRLPAPLDLHPDYVSPISRGRCRSWNTATRGCTRTPTFWRVWRLLKVCRHTREARA